MTGTLYFNPANVDEAWNQLKDKVIIEYPIENFDYGMRNSRSEIATDTCYNLGRRYQKSKYRARFRFSWDLT